MSPAITILGRLCSAGEDQDGHEYFVELRVGVSGRVITVSGLTTDECRACADLLLRDAQISIQGALP